ncbi:MAG TPA: hypothetical protein PLU53_06210 [Bacteroidia bacterium]|nr:hypothetical protein [Bacteroidia bacterium]
MLLRCLHISSGFVVLLQVCSKSCIYWAYVAEKSYISKVLCENKYKPSLHCHGSCHLKKELNKEEQNNSRQVYGGKEKSDHFFHGKIDFPKLYSKMTEAIRITDINAYNKGFGTGIFQPQKNCLPFSI